MCREDKPLDRGEIVKGFEYAKDRYVVVEQEELEKITPTTASIMEILQFVRIEEVDPIFFETSYYMSPEGSVTRPYSLLLEAMKDTNYDAVAKVTMHGREHIAILRPSTNGIVLHTMYFVDELHKEREVTPAKTAKPQKKELDLAKQLIETLAAPFKPEQFHDDYRRNVERLIQAKQKGRKVTPIKQPKKAPVIDLMQALQKSLKGKKRRPCCFDPGSQFCWCCDPLRVSASALHVRRLTCSFAIGTTEVASFTCLCSCRTDARIFCFQP